jgi:hypothetical protein
LGRTPDVKPHALGSARRILASLGGEEAVAISTVLDGRSAGHVFTLTASSALPGWESRRWIASSPRLRDEDAEPGEPTKRSPVVRRANMPQRGA